MTEIRTASAIVIATISLALLAAPDALASKEKFVRDKPHVNIDAEAATVTESADQAAGKHDHGDATGGCKMQDMKADGGGCKMHAMKAKKEGKDKGCKMMEKKQKRMQMQKQSGAEHKHGDEEATD